MASHKAHPTDREKHSLDNHDRSHHAAHVAGNPKKGGAGGKYTWGVPGVSDMEVPPADPRDPNYESDEDGVRDKTVVLAPVAGVDALTHYKAKYSGFLDEYFVSEDVGEVARSLQELNEGAFLYEFVKTAIVKSLDKYDRERELTSALLSALYGSILPEDQISRGLKMVLSRLPDLLLDIPTAVDLIGDYVARAVVDEIVPPSFLHHAHGDSEPEKQALARAKRLLEGKNVGERVYNIWSNGSSVVHSAKKLKKSMRTLLEEYLEDGGDVAEAEKCLRELNLPTMHFQFVKIAVTLALERKEPERRKVSALLQAFAKSGVVSTAHIVSGFKACVDRIGDLVKDISPNARTLLLDFISLAIADGYLPAAFKPKAEEETTKVLDFEKAASLPPTSSAPTGKAT
jgi:programmed cell death protein 4